MADIIGNISAIETITGTIGVQQIRGQISPGIDTDGGGGGSSDNDHRIVDAGLSPSVNTLTPKIVTVSGKIGALSGTPPLTFRTAGSKLYDYVIYGAQNGVGDYVGDNLFDAEMVQGGVDSSTGIPRTTDTARMHSEPLTPLSAGTYSFSVDKSSSAASTGMQAWVFVYDNDGTYTGTYAGTYAFPFTYTLSADSKIRLNICYTDYSTTITPDHIERVTIAPVGADAPTITDGYAIPVTVRSKNLLENNFQSETYHGLTVTVNADKSITVNGTANATTTLALHDGSHLPASTAQEIENGTYYLSGVPAGAETGTYTMSYRYTPASGGSSQVGRIPVEGMTLDNTSGDYRYLSVYIAIWGGVTVNNVTFYPMLRKSGTTDGYEPPYKNTVTVPIDKPLGFGETVSLSDSGVNISTLPNGTNTLSVGTTVAPAEAYIRYRTTS